MDRIVYQIEESRAGAGWSAYCPEFQVTVFGDSREEARTALRRQVSDYLEDCEQLGALDDVLGESGFYDNGDVWMSSLIEPPQPSFRFLGTPFEITDEDSGR